MQSKLRIIIGLSILWISVLSCNLPALNNSIPPETLAAQTVAAMVTQTVKAQAGISGNQTVIAATVAAQLAQLTLTSDISSTRTPGSPSLTPSEQIEVSPSTATSLPTTCNWASFISDVTYPDDTQITSGESFVKTWQIKNIGTCTWTSQYRLVFDHGDRMGAPDAIQLTNSSVSPGGRVNVSINLRTPITPGIYQAYFRFKAPDGSIFGIGSIANDVIWAKIEAVTAAEEEPDSPAGGDLIVQSFLVTPNSFSIGNDATISLVVKNMGSAKVTNFVVKWYSGESGAEAKCSWNLSGLAAGETSGSLNCTYKYAKIGQYDSYIVVDADNQVIEANEGNNSEGIQVNVLMKLIPITPILPKKPIKPFMTLQP